MSSSSPLYYWRAKGAGLKRDRKPDDPELLEAQRNVRALSVEARINKILAGEPRLTRDQTEHLVTLLRSAGGEN